MSNVQMRSSDPMSRTTFFEQLKLFMELFLLTTHVSEYIEQYLFQNRRISLVSRTARICSTIAVSGVSVRHVSVPQVLYLTYLSFHGVYLMYLVRICSIIAVSIVSQRISAAFCVS